MDARAPDVELLVQLLGIPVDGGAPLMEAEAVEPLLFDSNEQEANVKGADNMIALEAERVGIQAFFGAGAGGYPTASNVLADCIEISQGCEPFYVKL